MHYKFSVIIPLYNKQEYIEQTINSVLSQSYTNLEVVVVDDCSDDESYSVVNNIVKIDSRVSLHQNDVNSGVSTTRNHGISKISGDYVLFLDADDYISNVELFFKLNEHFNSIDIDYVFLKRNYYNKFLKPKKRKMNDSSSKITRSLYKIKHKEKFLKKHRFPLGGSGSAVVHKSMLQNKQFDEEMSNFEDWLFFTEVLIKSNDVYFYDKDAIYINFVEGSLSRTKVAPDLSDYSFNLSKYYYYLEGNEFTKLKKIFFWINLTGAVRNPNFINSVNLHLRGVKGLMLKNFIVNKHSVYVIIKIIVGTLKSNK